MKNEGSIGKEEKTGGKNPLKPKRSGVIGRLGRAYTTYGHCAKKRMLLSHR
jgi:hypothetical protein